MATPISSRTALLRALSRGPGYGLQLIERIAAATSGHLVLNRGRVYVVLHQLEEAGLVVSHEREEVVPGRLGGGRPRRYYELTSAGRREWEKLRAMLEVRT